MKTIEKRRVALLIIAKERLAGIIKIQFHAVTNHNRYSQDNASDT